jgi:ribosomal protein L11 methyltransferase
MSFGTGHHATTYMMIQCLEFLNVKNKTVFDFGTGTGILAILAEKEEAHSVLAIDNDEWSIENTRENILMNHSKRISLLLHDKPVIDQSFDIILANINKHIIIETIPALAKQLNNGGVLCCSGFYDSDEKDVIETATQYQLKIKQKFEKSNWICLVFETIN